MWIIDYIIEERRRQMIIEYVIGKEKKQVGC